MEWKKYKLPLFVEILGIGVTTIGIGYEVTYGEDVGLITITVGSVIIATGSMLYAKVFKRIKNKYE